MLTSLIEGVRVLRVEEAEHDFASDPDGPREGIPRGNQGLEAGDLLVESGALELQKGEPILLRRVVVGEGTGEGSAVDEMERRL